MRIRSIDRDMFIVILMSSIAIVLAIVAPASWIPLRIVTLPLVLLLPGYAVTSALFPTQRFELVECLILSLGISLTLVILGGLLLNLTPFGLQAVSWAFFLGAITLGACAVTIVRRRKRDASKPASGRNANKGWRLKSRYGLFIGIACLILGGAVALSIIGAQQQPRNGFTQLWILPSGGTNHTTNAVSLGISNMEAKDMKYRLAVNMDGKVIKEWPSIELSAGQQWKATLVLPPSGHAGSARIEAMLYRVDSPRTVYRDVVLWLSAT